MQLGLDSLQGLLEGDSRHHRLTSDPVRDRHGYNCSRRSRWRRNRKCKAARAINGGKGGYHTSTRGYAIPPTLGHEGL